MQTSYSFVALIPMYSTIEMNAQPDMRAFRWDGDDAGLVRNLKADLW